MKKIITAACFTLISFSFLTGCSSDSADSITGSIEDNIVGKWIIVAQESENGYAEYYNTCKDFKDYIEFFNDGSYSERYYNSECETSGKSGQWKLHDYMVRVYDEQTGEVKTYIVTKLKGGSLALNEGIVQSIGVTTTITTYYSKQ